MSKKWYVLHVCTGKEQDVAQQLSQKGYKTNIPIESRDIRKGGKWQMRDYILFAGYIFIEIEYTWCKYYSIAKTPGVINILGGGKNPTPLQRKEVARIFKWGDLLQRPSTVMFFNDKYVVLDGILDEPGIEIIKINRRQKRAKIKTIVCDTEYTLTVSIQEPNVV